MNEKIKNALGEEIAAQVEAKLQEANIELGIVNDGSLVPADKHDSLKSEHKELQKKYTEDINGLNVKLKDLSGKENTVEELKSELEKIQEESKSTVEELQSKLSLTRKQSEFEKALLKKNVKEPYVDLLKKAANWDDIQIDGEEIKGIDEIVNSLSETYAEAFGEVKKLGGNPAPSLDNPIKTGKAKLIEEYNRIEKDPSLKAFDKGVRLRALDKEIRQTEE